MVIQQLTIFITGFLASIIAATPFGLVNLSVLEAAVKNDKGSALKIAHGAAVVEVLYAIIAIMAGKSLVEYINGNKFVHYFTVLIISAAGVIFLLKKKKERSTGTYGYMAFVKGIFLNLISFQVFLFWLMAITFLVSNAWIRFDFISLFFLLSGIWTGKMTVLGLYMLSSQRFVSKTSILATHIDRIIGVVLLTIAAIQVIRL